MYSPFFRSAGGAVLLLIALSRWGISSTLGEENVPLSSLDLGHVEQGWGKPQANRSVDGHPLTIGGVSYQGGVGTHADGAFYIALKRASARFTASVGVDDEVKAHPAAGVEFEVLADGKSVWKSGVMTAGQSPRRLGRREPAGQRRASPGHRRASRIGRGPHSQTAGATSHQFSESLRRASRFPVSVHRRGNRSAAHGIFRRRSASRSHA